MFPSSCRFNERRPARTQQGEASVERPTRLDGGGDGTGRVDIALPLPAFPRRACIHQRRVDLGAPVHRERGGRGGFVRLDECAIVTLIEEEQGWFRVSFPLTEERTEGWISRRYVMDDCGPCRANGDGSQEASDQGSPWPPQPRGMCLDAGATGDEQLKNRNDIDHSTAGGGAQGIPGTKVVVMSYNLWELYDGRGGDRYLAAEAHGASPAVQFEQRLSLFAKTLSTQEIDVLLLQEVEGSAIACALARTAWPRSGWSCFATKSSGASPQNVAVATRLKGTARWLVSTDRRKTGPRGVIELSLEGADGLTVTAVHLKSSRGFQGPDDCANARQRMGASAALATRYQGWSSVLMAGDFNIDPEDTGRALYDRTADVLQGRGFRRLCSAKAGCGVATYASGGSAIDLAFFRGGGLWRATSFQVISSAPHRKRTTLASDHFPVVAVLSR